MMLFQVLWEVRWSSVGKKSKSDKSRKRQGEVTTENIDNILEEFCCKGEGRGVAED